MGNRPVTAAALSRPTQTTLHGQSGLAAWLSDRPDIEVVARRHPFIEALGHHPMSDYAEQTVIGPSALWAQRRLNAGFVGGRDSYPLDLADLGREIGLGAGTGSVSPVVRTVSRLVDFHLAEIVDGRLGVSTMFPPLSRRQATRLPEHLATRHQELARAGSRQSDASPARTSLAIGLER
jgi:hypothetical protein